jgi:hypothetical protein
MIAHAANDIERTPPSDETAEEALIYSTISMSSRCVVPEDTARYSAVLESVPPEAFWNGRRAALWRVMRGLHKRSIPPDPILIQRQIAADHIEEEVGGEDALALLLEKWQASSPASLEHYAEAVVALHQRRTVMFACEEIAHGLTNGLTTVDALARLNRTITVATPPSVAAAFQTAADIVSGQEESMRWLAECLLPEASLVALCGEPKVGKTVFLAHKLSAMLSGRTFIGLQTQQVPAAVWLSEESGTTLRAPLRAAGLGDLPLHILTRSEMRRLPWALAAQAAVDKCIATGATVLVVDTFAAWAGLTGEQENQVGPVQDALRPLQTATTKGITVCLVHHISKDPGRQGVTAIRGSSAFAGAVDGFLLLRREGGQDSPLRSLYGAGRGEGWANGVRYELDPDGSLRRVAGRAQALASSRGPAILEAIGANPSASTTFIHKAVGGNKTQFLLALEELEASGKVLAEGSGDGTAKKWRIA